MGIDGTQKYHSLWRDFSSRRVKKPGKTRKIKGQVGGFEVRRG
jgi:hypothetical protein